MSDALTPQKSEFASLLNDLDTMQQSFVYAARRSVLKEAEGVIVRLEHETVVLRTRLAEQTARITELEIIKEALKVEGRRIEADLTAKLEAAEQERDKVQAYNTRLQERVAHQRRNLSRKYLGWAETKVGMQREIEAWRARASGEVPTFGHGAKYEEISALKQQLTDAQDEAKRLREALENLIREASAVANDHHKPRYTRLDQCLASAQQALTPTVTP